MTVISQIRPEIVIALEQIDACLRISLFLTVSTDQFYPGNEPGGIDNATHKTFPKLTQQF
jgi:hypothetical protein